VDYVYEHVFYGLLTWVDYVYKEVLFYYMLY